MKRKDLMLMVIAVVILLVAGYLAFTQLAPQSKSKTAGVEVEVVGAIPEAYDDAALTTLGDSARVRDFATTLDLTQGLNNGAPFGQ